ncbi:13K protein [Beet soil-borne mosaic virus]|uniref:13K protein n=1 Tax=Beet soil-borne mosaic virus TaxID=76343 RepID=Q9IF42_9VIRU|nr:13K protein [Beet soil-borne mosaic virus]
MADVEICRCQDSQEPLLNVTGYDLTSRVMFERIDIGPLGVLCNIGVLFHMSVIRRRDIFPWLNKITSINVSVDVPAFATICGVTIMVMLYIVRWRGICCFVSNKIFSDYL